MATKINAVSGYDKLAVWHGAKDDYIKSRQDYMITPVAYVAEWREAGNCGFPADYQNYKEARSRWLESAILEFKKTNPAPLGDAGNMVVLV